MVTARLPPPLPRLVVLDHILLVLTHQSRLRTRATFSWPTLYINDSSTQSGDWDTNRELWNKLLNSIKKNCGHLHETVMFRSHKNTAHRAEVYCHGDRHVSRDDHNAFHSILLLPSGTNALVHEQFETHADVGPEPSLNLIINN